MVSGGRPEPTVARNPLLTDREQRLCRGGRLTYVGSITELHGPAYCRGACWCEQCEDVLTLELSVWRPGVEHTLTHVRPQSVRLPDEEPAPSTARVVS